MKQYSKIMKTAVLYSFYFPPDGIIKSVTGEACSNDEPFELQCNKYLPFIKDNFNDCDIYCGFNFTDILIQNTIINQLNIYESGQQKDDLIVRSDASGYQKALELLKNSNKRYDRYYFIHNKTVTMHYPYQYIYFKDFCEERLAYDNFLNAHPEYGGFCKYYRNDRLDVKGSSGIISFDFNQEKIKPILWLDTLYIINGSIINRFLDEVQEDFFTTPMNLWMFGQFFPTIIDKYDSMRYQFIDPQNH